MTLLRLALALVLALASACAGTCSAMSPTGLGGGAMLGGLGRDMLAAPSSGDAPAPAPAPPGTPSLWYSAASIDGQNNATLSDSDPVCTWVDLGSLGVDATQGGTGACPTYRVAGGPGGGPAVVFDGGDWLSTGATAFAEAAQPNMVAVVANPDTHSGGVSLELFVDGEDATRRHFVGMRSTDTGVSAGAILLGSDSPAASTWHAVVATFAGASSAIRLNGTGIASGNAGTQPIRGLVIGARYDGTASHLSGSIDHVLAYDTPATATDVEAWFEEDCSCDFPVTP